MPRKKLSKDDRLASALTDPSFYAELELGFKLYPKQRVFLQKIGEAVRAWIETGVPQQISFASCNEGGKTRICAASAVLWLLNILPQCRINVTSGSWRQLTDQFMPSLEAHQNKYPLWTWLKEKITTAGGGFLRAYSCNNPGRAEGDHSDGIDKPLIVFVDEAKSAPVWLKGVVEGRVRPALTVLMSSHGFAEGWFYESQTLNRSKYSVIEQTAYECPHILPEVINKVRDDWKGFPQFADSILGLGFVPLVEDAVINAIALQSLYSTYDTEDEPEVEGDEKHAFCDFAWSGAGDENCLALRIGNEVTLEKCFHAAKLSDIVNTFIAEFTRLSLKQYQISGDEGGGGSLVIDALADRGWNINRVNNGGTPADEEHYVNIGAEMWYEASKKITDQSTLLPDDPQLRAQLVNRKQKPGPKGKLGIESKKDMKLRGVSSPDRADAVLGAMMPVGGYTTIRPMTKRSIVNLPMALPKMRM